MCDKNKEPLPIHLKGEDTSREVTALSGKSQVNEAMEQWSNWSNVDCQEQKAKLYVYFDLKKKLQILTPCVYNLKKGGRTVYGDPIIVVLICKRDTMKLLVCKKNCFTLN